MSDTEPLTVSVVALTPKLLARVFHEEYEAHAAEHGWSTHPATRVSYDELPESNRTLMEATAERVIARLRITTERLA